MWPDDMSAADAATSTYFIMIADGEAFWPVIFAKFPLFSTICRNLDTMARGTGMNLCPSPCVSFGLSRAEP